MHSDGTTPSLFAASRKIAGLGFTSPTSKDKILLDLTTFLRYNEAVRYRVLKYLFPDKKYAVRINAVMDKIVSAEKSEYALSSQWIFRISKGKAVFERQRKYKK